MNLGAKYFRTDFQVHTPRDLQFVGKEYITEDDRATYANAFIKACREKKIDAVAITDHHDLSFYKYINNASHNEVDETGNLIHENSRIIVFPGLELTIDLPCQALLIFDSNLTINIEIITKIYTALLIQKQNPDILSKSVQHERLPIKSIAEIYDKLNSIEDLQNKFIVLPNIKDNGGDSILRSGFHNEYANGKFVGGYLDRGQFESHKSKVGWNNVVDGKTAAYGYKSIGVFQTSDNRTDTFEHLGLSSTWVKWSIPTAEGLRQACLAKKSRILQETPKLPATRISNVSISNSKFLKTVSIDFNPQFNVCIGGRGTGKSSILQYVSWALGKDADTEKRGYLENFVNNTIQEGYVEVTVIKNSIPHIIKRTLSSYNIKIGNDEFRPTNSQNVVSIIRADSFAQKELSKHEKNRVNQLIKIIENAVNDDVESLKRQITENGNKIKEVAVSYETYLSNLKSSNDLKAQIESLVEQIKSLNEQLGEVPTEDQNIIKDNSLIYNEKSFIRSSEAQIASLVSQIENIIKVGNFSEITFLNTDIKNAVEFKTFTDSHADVVARIKVSLENALDLTNLRELSENKVALSALHEIHDSGYIAAKGRQLKFEQIIEDIEDLRNRLQLLTEDRNRVLEIIETEKGSKKQLQKLFYNRYILNLYLYRIIQGAILEIVQKSEGAIDIQLTTLENIDSIIIDFLRQVTGSKGQPARTQTFFNELVNGNGTYKKLLKFWYSIYLLKSESQSVEKVLKSYGLENNSLLQTDFERIFESFNVSSIVDFALKLPTYDLQLLYCKDPKNKIPFEDASYGQQAGAILTILLNQEFGPLIIDQPEDDLDNKVVHSITENIVAAKHKRQLIFSSHNANIAVNGDAELIMVFDHDADKSSGEVIAMGSIDKQEIKEYVKDIMEGGKIAFEMRMEKYGF